MAEDVLAFINSYVSGRFEPLSIFDILMGCVPPVSIIDDDTIRIMDPGNTLDNFLCKISHTHRCVQARLWVCLLIFTEELKPFQNFPNNTKQVGLQDGARTRLRYIVRMRPLELETELTYVRNANNTWDINVIG